MRTKVSLFLSRLRKGTSSILNGSHVLAFIPALTLGGFWFGGEQLLLVIALTLPAIFAVLGEPPKETENRPIEGMSLREGIENALNQALQSSMLSGRATASIVIRLDDMKGLIDRLGNKACEEISHSIGNRIQGCMREIDIVSRLEGDTFAIAIAPVRRADLETMIQISGRLQSAISEPISLDATTIYVTGSVGFCLSSRTPEKTGEAMLVAAEQALLEARRNGPSSIRGFTAEMQRQTEDRHALIDQIGAALENGEIRPWFQPQLSTDTGKVTGVEALARWEHPTRGMISPGDFLPAIEQAGLFERLGEVMLYHALSSLTLWEQAGFVVPQVGVNFASDELRNPKLVDKVRWELDRFDLTPERLAVEILETVVADNDDDVITRNIAGLSRLGCAIDLDDFGTGHASISNIRRFAIGRIKIDRSFVTKVDEDAEQQRMVSAILSMAERLELETLAEGVETAGEHTILAQLGCNHVQGFGLARPMPFDKTLEWMRNHEAKLQEVPKIGRQTG